MIHHPFLSRLRFWRQQLFVAASILLLTACGGSSAFDTIATQQATSTAGASSGNGDGNGANGLVSDEEATATPEASPAAGTEYTVQPGDVLSEIALNFGVTVEAIAEANDLDDPNQLTVGQVLQIPAAQD